MQAPIKHPDCFFIYGKWVKPSSSAKINVLNSGTEEPFASVAEAQEADITGRLPRRETRSIMVPGRG